MPLTIDSEIHRFRPVMTWSAINECPELIGSFYDLDWHLFICLAIYTSVYYWLTVYLFSNPVPLLTLLTHALSLTHPLTLSPSHSFSHPHSLTYYSVTHSLARALIVTLSRSLLLTLSDSLSHSLTHPPIHFLTLF